MYVVERKMKEKIVEFLGRIKSFSLLDYLLYRKMETLEASIDSKNSLIEYHTAQIHNKQIQINESKVIIADLEKEIVKINNKMDDIEKI